MKKEKRRKEKTRRRHEEEEGWNECGEVGKRESFEFFFDSERYEKQEGISY